MLTNASTTLSRIFFRYVLCVLSPCILMGCENPDAKSYGASYDTCILKNATKTGDEDSRGVAEKICERHFIRAPTSLETGYAEGKATINFDESPSTISDGNVLDNAIQSYNHPGDTMHAIVKNGDDDVVIKQIEIDANFFDGPPDTNGNYTHRKSLGVLTWTLDSDVEPNQSDDIWGTFDEGKAPSRFYIASYKPIKVLPHTGIEQKSHLQEDP